MRPPRRWGSTQTRSSSALDEHDRSQKNQPFVAPDVRPLTSWRSASPYSTSAGTIASTTYARMRAVSAAGVTSHIKTRIGAEEPNAILSDDQLVDLLRAKGFDIARRTVAKYREALGIGSSVQRRRQKAIGARAA